MIRKMIQCLQYSLKVKKSRQKGIPADYDQYDFTVLERNFQILIAVMVLLALGYIFYHRFLPGCLLCPGALFYPGIKKRQMAKKRKANIVLEFNDFLYVLISMLNAGKSIETALRKAEEDLLIIYPNEETGIIAEIRQMVNKLDLNISVVECFENFAFRAKQEDIENFSQVLKTSQQSGANLVEILRNTSELIHEKIEVKNEIETMLSQKQLENKVLVFAPIGVFIVLSLSAQDYMEPIFHGTQGQMIVTGCIGLIVLGIVLTRRILNIQI